MVDPVFGRAESVDRGSAMLEPLTKAEHDITFCVEDLRTALRDAKPVEALMLLELIDEAAQLAVRIRVLLDAKKGES